MRERVKKSGFNICRPTTKPPNGVNVCKSLDVPHHSFVICNKEIIAIPPVDVV